MQWLSIIYNFSYEWSDAGVLKRDNRIRNLLQMNCKLLVSPAIDICDREQSKLPNIDTAYSA